MLIYSFFNAAMIPMWIMSTKAMKLLKFSLFELEFRDNHI